MSRKKKHNSRKLNAAILSELGESSLYVLLFLQEEQSMGDGRELNVLANVGGEKALRKILCSAADLVKEGDVFSESEEYLDGCLDADKLQAKRDEAWNFVLQCDRALRLLRAKNPHGLH